MLVVVLLLAGLFFFFVSIDQNEWSAFDSIDRTEMIFRNELSSKKNLKHSADCCSFRLINAKNVCEICVLLMHSLMTPTQKIMAKNHKISWNDMWTIAVEALINNNRQTQMKTKHEKQMN